MDGKKILKFVMMNVVIMIVNHRQLHATCVARAVNGLTTMAGHPTLIISNLCRIISTLRRLCASRTTCTDQNRFHGNNPPPWVFFFPPMRLLNVVGRMLSRETELHALKANANFFLSCQ
jgi:hypothetical protein